MKKPLYLALVILSCAAHAGEAVKRTDPQMDSVTAGGANASFSSLTSSATGANARLQASVYNVAAATPGKSIAQNSTALIASGQTAATNIFSQSSADSQAAAAAAGGRATGNQALVASLASTIAANTTDRLGLTVGIADAAALTAALSLAGHR